MKVEMRVTRFFLVLTFVITACISRGESSAGEEPFALVDTISTDVALTLDQTAYVIGAVGTVTVHNNTDREIAYHLGCQSELEGDDGKMWIHVYRMDCSAIRVRPTRLGPGESASERYQIPMVEGIVEGHFSHYRLRLNVDSDSYFSKPFEIDSGQ